MHTWIAQEQLRLLGIDVSNDGTSTSKCKQTFERPRVLNTVLRSRMHARAIRNDKDDRGNSRRYHKRFQTSSLLELKLLGRCQDLDLVKFINRV